MNVPPASRPPGEGSSADRTEAAIREIAASQAAMREVVARLPRSFTYADGIDLIFMPDHAD